MADYAVLGLFHEATSTADAIEQLRGLGVTDDQITVMSSIPYQAPMLGRPRPRRGLGRVALVGAAIGVLVGLFLTVGIFLLYPLVQGGQPIIPIPPSLIVLFELSMLGAMWATFFGLLFTNGLPMFKTRLYDPRISEGHIGVYVAADESIADAVEHVLTDNGAHHMNREPIDETKADYRNRAFWASAAVLLVLVAGFVLLLAYEVIKIPFATQMEAQVSVGYEEGPRLAAPAAAIPVQGPELIAGQPASEPLPATENSLQRGQVLFDINCVICHGQDGTGTGTLSHFFVPPPVNLTGEEVQRMSTNTIFVVITQGRGLMPTLSENLSAAERWDVINYVRSLQDGG
jgi:mono/diheme cytochrome c family protein